MNSKNNDEISTFEMETKNNFDKIINAIGEMRQDINSRLDKIESRIDKIEVRLDKIETRVEKIEGRIDKIETAQNELKNEFREFKNYVEVQFEAVRQGIVKNYHQFDRLESQIAENRSVIFSTKAAVGELNERVYLLNKSGEQALKQ
ncbi:MAG: hypothetical protein ACR2F2_09940 [Pyrinomonadaceae bacterium]